MKSHQPFLVNILLIFLTACTSEVIVPTASPTFTPFITETPEATVATVSPTFTPYLTPTAEPPPTASSTPSGGIVSLIFAGQDSSTTSLTLLGGYQNNTWMFAEQAVDFININSDIHYFTLAGADYPMPITSINRRVTQSVPCTQREYRITLYGEVPPLTVGLNNAIQAKPRDVKILPAENETYEQELIDYLLSESVSEPVPQIQHILQTDLDGDGTNEIIIAASRFVDTTGKSASPGDYSLILMRRVVGNEVLTQRVMGNVYLAEEAFPFPPTHSVQEILDVNGNGIMEVLIYRANSEGNGTILFELQGDMLQEVLQVICIW